MTNWVENLDNFGYLFGETFRILENRFDEIARNYGVTRTQWVVLRLLKQKEGVSQAQMAKQLEVEPITLCRMVDRLQAAGLVERQADPGDRRIKLLYLTDKANKVLEGLRSDGAKVLVLTSRGVSDEDIALFQDVISRFRDNLLKEGFGPVSSIDEKTSKREIKAKSKKA